MINYKKFTLYGNSLTDYLWIKEKVDTDEDINKTLSYEYRPKEDDSTIFLTNFENTINDSSSKDIQKSILNWIIYKNKPNDNALTFVAKIPVSQMSIIDFNILNNTQYLYTIFGETEDGITIPIQTSNFIKTRWENWSIIDLNKIEEDLYYIDKNNIWMFNCNLSSGAQTQNIDTYTFDNFTQFPKVSMGEKNYYSGSLQAFLGNVNNNGLYKESVDLKNKFKNFIDNGKIKLLRDRCGDGMIVQTVSNNFQYNDITSEQIITVSFDFIQIDNCENLRIIGV